MITSIDRWAAHYIISAAIGGEGGGATSPPPTDVPSPQAYHFSMCIHYNNRDKITAAASDPI